MSILANRPCNVSEPVSPISRRMVAIRSKTTGEELLQKYLTCRSGFVVFRKTKYPILGSRRERSFILI